MKTRHSTRYWPIPGACAEFTIDSYDKPTSFKSSRIWDLSRNDCAMTLNTNEEIPLNIQGKLNLKLGTKNVVDINNVIVKRSWHSGIAVSFNDTPAIEQFCSFKKNQGISHCDEAVRKEKLALTDISQLGAEIREIKSCQLKIFLTCFTITIALWALLTTLHQFTAGSTIRTLVAIGPAWVTLACCLLTLQKDITLNRMGSYLVLLKQQVDQGSFFPCYRGWEDALGNYHICKHGDCGEEPRCPDRHRGKTQKIHLRSQAILFTALTGISYAAIYLISLVIAILLIIKDPSQSKGVVFLLGIIATVFVVLIGIVVVVGNYLVRKGKWSIVASYTMWEHVLGQCVPFHPERICRK